MIRRAIGRSVALQGVLYGLLIGALCLLPVAIAVLFIRVGPVFGWDSHGGALSGIVAVLSATGVAIAILGALPAAGAATISWWLLARGRPLGVPRVGGGGLWLATFAGAYLLVPVSGTFVFGQSPVGCGIRDVSSAALCVAGIAGSIGRGLDIALYGLVPTWPLTLPLSCLGAWLWVRRIRPWLVRPLVAGNLVAGETHDRERPAAPRS